MLERLHLDVSRARKYKSCMGLKITAYMSSWDKFWTQDRRSNNPTAISEQPEAKAGG